MQNFGVIYLICNNCNDKKYVGQTRQSFERSIVEHKRDSKKSKIGVDAAIRKYGWENFIAEVIEMCLVEQLNEREIFWISELNSKVPNGYNLTDGGDGGSGFTAETLAKMSAKKKGVPKSAKQRLNIGLSNRNSTPYKNLLNEIEQRQFTYFELAKMLGLSSSSTFSNKILGRYNFTAKYIAKLVEIFNLPAEYLMARTDGLSATISKTESLAKISEVKRGYSPFKNLLNEIDKRQFTYRGLSKLTGICKSSLPLKMSGKVKFTADEIAKLTEIFDKPIEYLMFKEEFL